MQSGKASGSKPQRSAALELGSSSDIFGSSGRLMHASSSIAEHRPEEQITAAYLGKLLQAFGPELVSAGVEGIYHQLRAPRGEGLSNAEEVPLQVPNRSILLQMRADPSNRLAVSSLKHNVLFSPSVPSDRRSGSNCLSPRLMLPSSLKSSCSSVSGELLTITADVHFGIAFLRSKLR